VSIKITHGWQTHNNVVYIIYPSILYHKNIGRVDIILSYHTIMVDSILDEYQ